jgi:16S rRNA (guanine527-N7)-methyltransferase
MNEELADAGERLNALLATADIERLNPERLIQFKRYLLLLIRWNARINLTAVRTPDQILSRHFVESIACARALPEGIGTLLDFGSGAGFPGIPIAICRPEIAVTLAESQNKKAAFLRECVRTIGIASSVHSGRAETLTEKFDCVTLRAVDRMGSAVEAAAHLVRAGGWIVAMSTLRESSKVKDHAGPCFTWHEQILISDYEDQVVAFGKKASEPDS